MTTATVARPLADAAPSIRTGKTGHAIEIAHGFDGVAATWRNLEARAVMSPYGRLDWLSAFQESLPAAERDTRVAILRGPSGEVLALMAFQVERRFGMRVAAAIGGKHVNYNLPVMSPDFAASPMAGRPGALLAEIGRAMGVDMIVIPNVPASWNGWRNPVAALGRPAAADSWALRLERDGEATLARSMSRDARKKLRSKARGLATCGPVRLMRAETPADIRLALDAFHRQKEERFGELGIADPFANPSARRFLERVATPSAPGEAPAIELYALLVADEIIAVIGGASDGSRFSGMVVSFQSGPFERYSPGEMLVTEVVKDLCARGFAVFDLGAGDARYKRSICDETEALVDIAIPLTLKGKAAGAARAGLVEAKRRLKASPRAMALLARLRRIRARQHG